MPVNKKISFSIWYVFLAIWAVILVHDYILAMQKIEELPYSEFRTLVASGNVAISPFQAAPALLTRMSMPPKRAIQASTAA